MEQEDIRNSNIYSGSPKERRRTSNTLNTPSFPNNQVTDEIFNGKPFIESPVDQRSGQPGKFNQSSETAKFKNINSRRQRDVSSSPELPSDGENATGVPVKQISAASGGLLCESAISSQDSIPQKKVSSQTAKVKDSPNDNPTPKYPRDANGNKVNMKEVLMRENNKYYQQKAITAKIQGLANLGLIDFGISGESQANNTTKETAGHLALRSPRTKVTNIARNQNTKLIEQRKIQNQRGRHKAQRNLNRRGVSKVGEHEEEYESSGRQDDSYAAENEDNEVEHQNKLLDSGSKKRVKSNQHSQITGDPNNLLNDYGYQNQMAENQSGIAISVSEQNVLIQQCKLKRQRFMFQGRDAHSIDNFGGKSLALQSFRAKHRDEDPNEQEVQSERSDTTIRIQTSSANEKQEPLSKSKVLLKISGCRVQRPKLGKQLIYQSGVSKNQNAEPSASGKYKHSSVITSPRVVSPREQVSDKEISIESENSNDQIEFNVVTRKNSRSLQKASEELKFGSYSPKRQGQLEDAENNDTPQIIFKKSMAIQTSKVEIAPKTAPETRLVSPLKSTNPTSSQRLNFNQPMCMEIVPSPFEIQQMKYKQYLMNKSKEDQEKAQKNQDEFTQCKNFIMQTQIPCFKYNNSLDKAVQKQNCYEATMSLSSDGKQLIIINRKPKTKLNNGEVDIEQQMGVEPLLPNLGEKDGNISDSSVQSTGLIKQVEKRQELKEIHEHAMAGVEDYGENFFEAGSSASCFITEIDAFIVGGFSSRFWVLRKHINSLNKEELKKIPFHSWNCITLKIGRRDIDLVIKNEKHMAIFQKFLIYSLNTLNGIKNSAKPLLLEMTESEITRMKKITRQVQLSAAQVNKINQINEAKVFGEISKKYKLLMIRAKISFMALERGMTVQETILHAIWTVYNEYLWSGVIPIDPKLVEVDEIYRNIISGEKNIKMIAQYRFEQEQQQELMKLKQYNPIELLRQKIDAKVKAQYMTDAFKMGLRKSYNQFLESLEENPFVQYENYTKQPDQINHENTKKKSLKDKQKKRKKRKKIIKAKPTADQIQQIIRKDKCMEIFKDYLNSQDQSAFSSESISQFVAYKFKKKIRQIRHNTLNMMINMKLIKGPRYIEALLQRSLIVKELFLLDIEQGLEVNIPKELSQDNWPQSFRYYDSILMIIQHSVTSDRRQFSKMKSKLNVMFEDKLSLSMRLGIGQLMQKLKSKQKANVIKTANKQPVEEINYNQSHHTKEVQRSRYLVLDDNKYIDQDFNAGDAQLLNQKSVEQLLGYQKQKEAEIAKELIKQNAKAKNVHIKYVKPADVHRRNQDILQIKSQFQQRQNILRYKGQFLQNLHRLEQHIEQNIDKLFTVEMQRRIKLYPQIFGQMNEDQLFKEKKKFKQYLINASETLVRNRHTVLQMKKTDNIKSILGPGSSYEERLKYIEQEIEADIQYFNKNDSDEALKIDAIKATLRQKQKLIQKMQEEQLYKKAHKSHHHRCKTMRPKSSKQLETARQNFQKDESLLDECSAHDSQRIFEEESCGSNKSDANDAGKLLKQKTIQPSFLNQL